MDENENQIDVEKVVREFCGEVSSSMTRVEAEKEFQKEAVKNISEQTGIPKNILKFCAKTFHKQDFDSKVETHTAEQKIYAKIFGNIDDVDNDDIN